MTLSYRESDFDIAGFIFSYFLVSIFFFFQAEDGIRDLTVTEVQTCALPIWPASSERSEPATHPPDARTIHAKGSMPLPRSEERRVGKECRSRWSPYQ